MKKILFLLGMIALFAIGVQAQDYTVSRNGTNFNIALDAGDTITDTGTLSKTIGVGNKQSVQLYTIQVSLDSISGTPAEAVVLAGSLDNVNWTTITTVNWAGSASDTTFFYTDISTGVGWSYLRVKSTGSGTGKGQLMTLVGRFFDEVK